MQTRCRRRPRSSKHLLRVEPVRPSDEPFRFGDLFRVTRPLTPGGGRVRSGLRRPDECLKYRHTMSTQDWIMHAVDVRISNCNCHGII